MDVINDRFAAIGDAVERLYRVFVPYKPGRLVKEGPMYPAGVDTSPLFAAPLRKLPAEAFERYLWKAMTTWGSVEDYKHFLPRILELHTPQGDGVACEHWILFEKMAYGEFAKWPKVEREAIHAFNLAVWRYLLVTPECFEDNGYQNGFRIRDWIDAVCGVEPIVKPFTDVWEDDLHDRRTHLLAVKSIAAVVTGWMYESPKGDRLFAYSNVDKSAQGAELVAWLTSPKRIALMENEFFKHQDKPIAKLFSRAQELLVWRQSRLRQTN